MERDGLGPIRYVYSDAMVDTFRRIGRVHAPCTSAGGTGVAAVPSRAPPRINPRAAAKGGTLPLAGAESPTIAFRHRGAALNTRAWGAPSLDVARKPHTAKEDGKY